MSTAIRSLLRCLAPITAITMLLTGCVQVDQKVTIRSDGSGLVEVQYAVPAETTQRIRAAQLLQKQLLASQNRIHTNSYAEIVALTFMDPSEDNLKLFLKELEPYGVSVEKLEVTSRHSSRVVRLNVAWRDLRRFAASPFYKQYGFSVSRRPGKYILQRAPIHTKIQPPPTAEELQLLTPIMGTLDLKFTVRTPGEILSSTAPKKAQQTAEWEFTFKDNPNALNHFQTTTFQIVVEDDMVNMPEVRL